MVESAYVREAKIERHAEIVADANDLKAGSDVSVSAARRAERDALVELADEHDDPDAVRSVDLPSERVDGDDE